MLDPFNRGGAGREPTIESHKSAPRGMQRIERLQRINFPDRSERLFS
jgi:hypothetical protein